MAARSASRSRSPVPPTVRTPEQAQDYVRTLPAAELLELCCWRVARQWICEDTDVMVKFTVYPGGILWDHECKQRGIMVLQNSGMS